MITIKAINNNFQSKRYRERGVTLVELIVVIALVVVLTSTVLLRQRSFQDSILLRNTAYELALSVRETQVYGVGVRRDPSDIISGRYGVHLELDTSVAVIYADNNENNLYESDEQRKINEFEEPFSIVNICVTPVSGGEECADSAPSIIGLEILFIRPNPDAYLYVVHTGNVIEEVSKARISVGVPSGKHVDVIISKTGQIAVQ